MEQGTEVINYNTKNLVALRAINVLVDIKKDHLLAMLQVRPSIRDQIKEAQMEDSYLKTMTGKVEMGRNKQFTIREDGTIVIKDYVCVPNVGDLRKHIIDKAHNAPYTMHPESTKMYRNIKPSYWWPMMRKDVAEFMAKYLTYQQVKVEHQAPAGKLQSLIIPEWKWEKIIIDFVLGLPRTFWKHDTVWVIVDRLIKSAHFLLMQ